ncbi:EpsG family protein [Bacteroides nordii]|uniref:EpsG family protein n=1 Tax=Bacteroides nordii TaxID=291645 RepID=UPI0020404E1E|nr:EpsG family protein [Bacteroides nordii]GFZ42099.1 hypothetical protein BANORC5_41340 [Bacteroides nordii]
MIKILNRTFEAFCFFMFPFIVMCRAFYDYANDRNRILNFLFIFVFFGFYGYVMNASYDSELDIMRLYNAYDTLKDLNFFEALPYILSVGDLSYTLFWGLGQLGMPAQILGFLSAGWFYSGWLLLISLLYRKLSDIKKYSMLLLSFILFITSTYPLLFSGIRTSTGMIIVLFGLLQLFAGKKQSSFWLILLATLFHFSFFSFFILWLICVFTPPHSYKIWMLSFCVGALIYPALMELILRCVSGMGIVGGVLAAKIQSYIFDFESESRYSIVLTYGSGWRFISNLIVLGSVLVVRTSAIAKEAMRENLFFGRLDRFLLLFICFLFFISSNKTMLGRFIVLLILLCIIYLIALFIISNSSQLRKKIYFLATASVILGFIAIWREMELDYISYIYTAQIFCKNVLSILSTTVDYSRY